MAEVFTCGYPENTLAHYAEYQGNTQSCGEYAVAAAMSLLKGQPKWLPAQEVVSIADSWTLVDSLLTMGPVGLITRGTRRMWKGGPTTCWQVANLAQMLAKKRGVQVNVAVSKRDPGTRDDLIRWLGQGNTSVVVSIAWDDKTHAELIDPGGNRIPLTSTPAWKIMDMTLDYTAHVMVLAAYDDQQKRWGFINSWVDGTSVDHLYWMTDEDFGETWGYSRSPIFFACPWVTITGSI